MKIVNACGLLFFSGLLLIAYTAGVSGNWTKTVSQQNDDAAKKVERKFRQYKRVHQDLLKKIVAGKEEDALAELDLILKVVPKDGESHYMKAVCYARMNQPELAIKHVRAALELGLESSRFRGGTKTGLESLRGVPAFEAIFEQEQSGIVHGPMVGQNTGDGLSFWLRTITECEVRVRCWEKGKPRVVTTGIAHSKQADDFTAIVRVDGLKPDTTYAYSVHLDCKPGNEEQFEVKTLAQKITKTAALMKALSEMKHAVGVDE